MPDDRERLLASRAATFAQAAASVVDAIPDGLPYVLVTLDPDTQTLAVESSGIEDTDMVGWLMIEATAFVNGST